ncbi:DUF805 domain-containing protein [Vibrio tapetis]|uniref:Putative membrane protein n=1 Tax=Vibrio tapetis subsp. tapetis TaxID=1671868 RepID=A0A2N8ZFZ6_9VIBR|nr:DUF805 domain-containing protein [Vibrio tapetis]SON50834.1 putative membrane protein [Vibrio tapetis subsp. tapetis]
MSIKQLLFSFQGRVGRKVFWIWNACYYIAIMGFTMGINVLFPAQAGIISVAFLAFLMLPDLAITAKRWHDRNKSNWFLLLNIPLILGRMFVPVGGADMVAQPTMIQTVASLAALACGAWLFIECGLLKGDDAENRYGKPQS